MRAFLRMQQWTELLLVLLHDEEPLPEVFDLTLAVLFNKHAALPAVVQLLGMLGMISAEHSVLDEEERQFINHCIEKEEVDPSMLSIIATKRLRALCRTIIEEHGGRMLRSPEVAVECNA